MLKTKNKNNIETVPSNVGGYSEIWIRFFVLIFMIFGFVMAPFIGVIGSVAVTLIFAVFTLIKVLESSGKTVVHIFKDDADLAIYYQRKAIAKDSTMNVEYLNIAKEPLQTSKLVLGIVQI